MSRLIATFFYVGHLRPAPGTWGSLAALPAAYMIAYWGGVWALLTATVIVFGAGLWATIRQTRGQTDHDPSEIVIDEVAGQWIALLPLSWGLWAAGSAAHVFPYPGWIAGFVLFRLFDIWKPGPVGWAERRHGAFGIMADDVVAGLIAAMIVTAAAAVSHGGFG